MHKFHKLEPLKSLPTRRSLSLSLAPDSGDSDAGNRALHAPMNLGRESKQNPLKGLTAHLQRGHRGGSLANILHVTEASPPWWHHLPTLPRHTLNVKHTLVVNSHQNEFQPFLQRKYTTPNGSQSPRYNPTLLQPPTPRLWQSPLHPTNPKASRNNHTERWHASEYDDAPLLSRDELENSA